MILNDAIIYIIFTLLTTVYVEFTLHYICVYNLGNKTAVVNILIGGDKKKCDFLKYIPKIPLVVIRGSGGLADKIADWKENTSEM